ncbi:MAG: hypothetical protein A3B82_03205 [Methylophilales bacterium RIFCSPHIGHO2_02_FULL_57_10]|nr:MAG: hypothetical protein A3B82_03205 [Methylophilales bacterium RIFCSPHIGHO2_02_FULL_57_10]
MRVEVHLHGYIDLCEGVTRRQVETAMRPLFDYLDVENMGEIQSLEESQPGIAYHQRDFGLEICCTLEVGGGFFAALEGAMSGIGRLAEQGTAIEVILYHADGRDETQLIFVGPSAEAIHDAQRRRMVEDITSLLRRQFNEAATDEVVKLVNDLFRRGRAAAHAVPEEDESTPTMNTPGQTGRRRLH